MRVESLVDLLKVFPDTQDIWSSEDLPETERKLQDLISKVAEKWCPEYVGFLTDLARVETLQGKLVEGGATLLLISERLFNHGLSDRRKLRFLIEQARWFAMSMKPAESNRYLGLAWDLSQRVQDTFSAIETAYLTSVTQPPKYQNVWLKRSLELAQQTNDESSRPWLPLLYVREGWHSFDFRNFEQALASFEKALTFDLNKERSLDTKWAVGRTLRALARINEALNVQNDLERELNSLGRASGHVYLEIAECLQLKQEHENARTFFELAYNELSLSGWYSDNKSPELSRIQYLLQDFTHGSHPISS